MMFKRVNKYLLAFIIFTTVLMSSVAVFVRSKYFGALISEQINQRISKDGSVRVEIGRIDFSFLNLSSDLNNIKVFVKEIADIHLQEVSVDVSIIDLFKSDINISSVSLSNGYIMLSLKNSSENSDQNLSEIDPFTFLKKEVLSKIPINIHEIYLRNIDIGALEKRIQIRSTKIGLEDKEVFFELNVDNLVTPFTSLDNIEAKLKLSKNKIDVESLSAERNRTTIDISGAIERRNKWELNLNSSYRGDIGEFYKIKELKSGICNCQIKITGDSSTPNFTSTGIISNINSIYVNSDKLSYSLNAMNGRIVLDELELQKSKSKIKISSPVVLDLETWNIGQINLNFDSVELREMISKDLKLENINGIVNGNLQVSIVKKVSLKSSGLNITDFTIGTNKKIIHLNNISLQGLDVSMGPEINLELKGSVSNSPMYAVGSISNNYLDIKLKLDKFELFDLGGVVSSYVKGIGAMDAHFLGPLENIQLSLIANNVQNMRIMDYGLHELSNAEINYNLSNNYLKIIDLNSDNRISVNNGYVDIDKGNLDLEINYKNLLTSMFFNHLKPIWEGLKVGASKVDGVISGKTIISGKFEHVSIRNFIESKKMNLFNENIDSLNLDLEYLDNKINVRELKISKGVGQLVNSLVYDLNKSLQFLKVKIEGFRLYDSLLYRSLNLGYDTEVVVDLEVEKKNNYFYGGGNIDFLGSYVGRRKIKPSKLTLQLDHDEMYLTGSILGARAKFDSKIFYNSKENQVSTFNSSVDIDDLRLILGMVSLHNIYDSDLSGEMKGDVKLSTKIKDLSKIDLDVNLEKFNFSKFDKAIKLNTDHENKIQVRNSEIELFDIALDGTGGEYKLSGLGDLNGKIKLEQKFSTDLSFLHVLSQKITRVGGRIFGSGVLVGNLSKFENSHQINAENVVFIYKDVPLVLNNFSFKSVVSTNKIDILELKGVLGSGDISGKGKIDLLVPYPNVNIGIKLSNVLYPVADNSRIRTNAYLDIVGNKIPYLLRGNFNIISGSIEDEFTAFAGGSGFQKSVDKYIQIKEKELPDLVLLDIEAKTAESLAIKNRMADLYANAQAKVSGSPLNPSIKARVQVIPGVSKFKFKGNDFFVNEGLVDYDSTNPDNNLHVNFTSLSKIAQYDIKMDVVGSDDDLKINMESNPSLSKEDIFSLLALGVTSDFAKNLEDKDRTSLTTIGLGTLLVDQLKINEGLDSTLGLKLSVLPEVGENDSTPIQNSKSENVTKNKASTKLRIQKKISDKVGVTFSNTFGSSEGQKQEINVDLNINDAWSVQGVFESETDSKTKSSGDNGSVGADVIYKWEF